MQNVAADVVTHPDGSMSYSSPGWGEKCPPCGKPTAPGQRRRVRPKEWRPYHEECFPALSQKEIDAELEALL